MSMQALVHHLDVNRPLILQRALVAGAAGMVPVPYLDDLLAGAVRASLIRRLAEIRNVDLDANAVDALATPRGSRLLQAATVGSVALHGTRRIFRSVTASLLLVRRVDEAMQTFAVGTLFDHYCASHHVGFGLDGQRAAELRSAIDRAVADTHGDALARAFRSSLSLGWRLPGAAALALPRFIIARWKRRAQKGRVPLEGEKLDDELRRVEKSSWVERASGALGNVGRGYGLALAGAFDARRHP